MSKIIPFTPRGADEPGMLKTKPPLEPMLLQMTQPIPTDCLYLHFGSGLGGHTAILREWNPDEIGRCQLCPRCYSLDGRTCLVGVNGIVPPEDAAMYDANDHRESVAAG